MRLELQSHLVIVSKDEALLAEARRTFMANEAPADWLSATMPIRCDQVIVVDLDDEGGLDMICHLAAAGVKNIVAVAGSGAGGSPLEHVLLKAELRGARAALPKPLDVDDLLGLIGRELR